MLTRPSSAYRVFAPEGRTFKVQWVVLQSKEGKMNDMSAIGARTVAKYTPNEKGTYSLYGGVDKENHNIIRLLEIYEDEEAYQIHRSSEGFKQYLEQRAPILENLVILPVDPIVLEQKSNGSGSIVTMALFEVKPECLEDFKTLITTEMKRAVAYEDGVLGLFATSEQGDKNNRIHTMEIFRDTDIREKYLKSQDWSEYHSKIDDISKQVNLYSCDSDDRIFLWAWFWKLRLTLNCNGLISISGIILNRIAGSMEMQLIILFFRDDPEVIVIGSTALCWQMFTLPLNAMFMISNMMLQSIGKGVRVTIIASARSGIFFIPLIIILTKLYGLFEVEIAQPCADVCSFLLTIPMTRSVWNEMNNRSKMYK